MFVRRFLPRLRPVRHNVLRCLIGAARTSHHHSHGGSSKPTFLQREAMPLKPVPLPSKTGEVDGCFGRNVFDQRAMKQALNPTTYGIYQSAVTEGTPLPLAVYDEIAAQLLVWARARGATHFCHWFQPLNGAGAEKHDAFLDVLPDGETPIMKFTGKHLLVGETDGSSFPNGGIRSTHRARAFTSWDPTSPPFLRKHSNGATLYIPACFFSWDKMQALDDKTALLRAESALKKEALALFHAMGRSSMHTSFHTDSGLEQEFFLVKRPYVEKRLDLQIAGRSLLGSLPSKTQELEDAYFGKKSNRFLSCIHDFETRMWGLGVPMQTRHREVAPAQYEVAPKFCSSNIATDRNLLLMDVLKSTALDHGLVALFHEKPFASVNGSGKHNNFSFGTNLVPSLLEPGPHPSTNVQFMLFLGIMLRAVDRHGDLLRWSTATAGNDHRLGSHEAPPAIVSVYLGEHISEAIRKFLNPTDLSSEDRPVGVNWKSLGVPWLPHMTRATTDRNRTSSFAFVGNKFEYRSVGASQSPSRSNMVLDLILADAFAHATGQMLDWRSRSPDMTDEQVQWQVAAQLLVDHERVVFNGNGYSAEWVKEAKKRGLPNLATTPEALVVLTLQKNRELFQKYKVLSAEELESRSIVGYSEYCNKIKIEARILIDMIQEFVIPAATAGQRALAESITSVELVSPGSSMSQTSYLDGINANLEKLDEKMKILQEIVKEAENIDDLPPEALYHSAVTLPCMNEVRKISDELEPHLKKHWNLPTYQQMLFDQD